MKTETYKEGFVEKLKNELEVGTECVGDKYTNSCHGCAGTIDVGRAHSVIDKLSKEYKINNPKLLIEGKLATKENVKEFFASDDVCECGHKRNEHWVCPIIKDLDHCGANNNSCKCKKFKPRK